MDIRDGLKNAKRVVVKVGTSTITRPTGGSNLVRMEEIARRTFPNGRPWPPSGRGC